MRRNFVVSQRRLLVVRDERGVRLASVSRRRLGERVFAAHDYSSPELPGARVLELSKGAELPRDHSLYDIRRLLVSLDAAEAKHAMRALHIAHWAATHRFCGSCGQPTTQLRHELARRCDSCEVTVFPRISPAVIVLVTRGDEVLLGRGTHLPEGLFSVLAGFVEPGESLEETVEREIREEVGIEIRDIRYFGSQPWPLPDSLMIGFTAKHASGEIEVDPKEIAEAGWFAVDQLPPVPPTFSIARVLIDAWVRDQGGDPARVKTWKR